MKRLVVAIVLVCMLASPAWTMNDKVGHAFAGASIAWFGTPEQGLQTALLMGVVKEISDSTNGGAVRRLVDELVERGLAV